VIDSIPKLQRYEMNLQDGQKRRNEVFLDVCESRRYGVMSYASEQSVPREVEIQREIQKIPSNTQKYIRYLELSSRPRLADIAFAIPRGWRSWQNKS